MKNEPGLLRWLVKMTISVMAIWAIVVLGFVTMSGCGPSEEDGWTYVTTIPSTDKVYMKHFPERKITIYYTARCISVVPDER